MNIELRHSLILLVIVNLLAPNALAMSNIDPTDKYAWSFTSGWINFHPNYGGVTVYPNHLEGYAWSEQSGWIQLGSQGGGNPNYYSNTSSTNWGVNHDGAGHLSGYAWSKALGWINFNPTDNQVTIDMASGEFQGAAWSEQGGWINFQQTTTPAYQVRYSKAQPIPLTLTVTVNGHGHISSIPPGIDCGEGNGDCIFSYDEGTSVTLTPVAAADSRFSSWEGDSDCNDEQVVITANKVCIANFEELIPEIPTPLPPSSDTTIIPTIIDGKGQIFDGNVFITANGSLSHAIFTGTVENHGLISNSTVAAGALLKGSTLTGTINNKGTIADVKFVGAKISGGKMAGTIINDSQIKGIIENVQLLPNTLVSEGWLGGQIDADPTSTIRDVQLAAGLRLTGGQLDGEIQGQPENLARIAAAQIQPTAQLAFVCLDTEVQLPSTWASVIGAGVTYQIPQLDNQCISEVEPSQFNQLNAEQISQIHPPAFLAIGAQQLREFTPAGIAAITTEQFKYLSPEALSGLTSTQMSKLSTTILDKFLPTHVAAINSGEFRRLPNTTMAKLLVYLNANNVSPTDIKSLLPTSWQIDPQTGALTAPVGTLLSLRTLPPPDDLPPEVELPPLPDFQTSFALGGHSDQSIEDSLNQVLVDFTVSQDNLGMLQLTSPEANYALMPNLNYMKQVEAEVTPGLSRDAGGFFLLTTQERQQYQLISAPTNPLALSTALGGKEIVLGADGDVLMKLPEQVVVALFDPLVTSSSNETVGLHLPTERLRKIESAQVVYPDGTAQTIWPTFLSPSTFIDTGFNFDNQVESINLVANGSFYVTYDQKPYVIVPQFEVKTEALNSEKAREPAISYDAAAATLEYVIANTDKPTTRSRQTRQTLFSFVAEIIPYECQVIEAGIMSQNFYCSMDKGLLWWCQSEPYYGPLWIDEWLGGIDWWLGVPYCPPYY
jgi:hypothetical protein